MFENIPGLLMIQTQPLESMRPMAWGEISSAVVRLSFSQGGWISCEASTICLSNGVDADYLLLTEGTEDDDGNGRKKLLDTLQRFGVELSDEAQDELVKEINNRLTNRYTMALLSRM